MKNNKIQLVRTSGLIGVLALGGLTAVMIFCPWGVDSKEIELVRAQKKAEVLAYQIIEIYKEAKAEAPAEVAPIQSRGLASVQSHVEAAGILKEFKNQGTMGIDPWGHPYQYKIIPNGPESKLVVWSLGPKGTSDDQVGEIRVQLPIPEAASR